MTGKQRERERERQRQRQRQTDRERETERERDRDRNRETDRDRQTDRDRETETKRQRQRDKQTARQTARQTETGGGAVFSSHLSIMKIKSIHISLHFILFYDHNSLQALHQMIIIPYISGEHKESTRGLVHIWL